MVIMEKGISKKYFSATSVLVGSCIGAGVLGIPFVAAQSGFFVALAYILIIGLVILLVNLYLGEIILRTKGDHQLIGYVEKYLGRRARHMMEFAVIFGIYAALIAYMLGLGKSLSFLVFGNFGYDIHFGIAIGLLMSLLLRGGLNSLKKFEKYGVLIILSLLIAIFFLFIGDVKVSNLINFNFEYLLLPFGVVLFALMSFHSIPEIKLILKRKENLFKRVLWTGSIISVLFYSLFTLVVVGYKGMETPDIATLALGTVFVFLGVFTMLTSYLASGNALRESFQFDERYTTEQSWFLATIVPIFLFLFTQLTDFFSFTTILSLGGVVSGGIMAIMILFMVRKSKKHGNRQPEYSIPFNWELIWFLIFIFVVGMIVQLII